jgi:hypothetical protein
METVGAFLSKNLPWILMIAASGYSGFTSGQTRIGDLEALEKRNEAEYASDRLFLNCLVRHVDRIETGSHDRPPCELTVPE